MDQICATTGTSHERQTIANASMLVKGGILIEYLGLANIFEKWLYARQL